MKKLSVYLALPLTLFLVLFSCKNESDIVTTPLNFNDIEWSRKIRLTIEPTDKGFNEILAHCKGLLEEANSGSINAYTYGGSNFEELIAIPNFSTTSYDTVALIDPETYEESIEILKNEMSLQDVGRISVSVDMHYNASANKIVSKINSLAPCEKVFDDKGNYRGSRPIAYFSKNDKYNNQLSGNLIAQVEYKMATDDDEYMSKPLPQSKDLNLLSVLMKNNITANNLKDGYYVKEGKVHSPVMNNGFDATNNEGEEIEVAKYVLNDLNGSLNQSKVKFDLHYSDKEDAFFMKIHTISPLEVTLEGEKAKFGDESIFTMQLAP